jgi:hypothetical protein
MAHWQRVSQSETDRKEKRVTTYGARVAGRIMGQILLEITL